jgi:hypothetical protein
MRQESVSSIASVPHAEAPVNPTTDGSYERQTAHSKRRQVRLDEAAEMIANPTCNGSIPSHSGGRVLRAKLIRVAAVAIAVSHDLTSRNPSHARATQRFTDR